MSSSSSLGNSSRKRRAPSSASKRRFIRSRPSLFPNRAPARVRGMNGDLRTYSFVQSISTVNNTTGLAAASGFVNGTTTNDAYVIGASTATPGTPAFAAGAFTFCLSDLDQAASFQALFEEYRLNMVKLSFIPIFNEAALTSAATRSGELYVMHDFEDNTAVADLTVLRQRQDTQIAASYQALEFVCKPRVLASVLLGSGSAGAASPTGGHWIQTASAGAGTQHFGCKYAIANMGDTTVPKWIVRFKYYIQFRNLS